MRFLCLLQGPYLTEHIRIQIMSGKLSQNLGFTRRYIFKTFIITCDLLSSAYLFVSLPLFCCLQTLVALYARRVIYVKSLPFDLF